MRGVLGRARRVAGVRRSDVAALAWTSIEYYAKLEPAPSPAPRPGCLSPWPGLCSSTTPNEP